MLLPTPSDLARHWRLDPGTVHLNHGSFGACPIPVLNAQTRYRDQMEGDGVRWFIQDMYPYLDRARASLSALVDADPGDLVFVPNATTGVTTALDSLGLGAGDEVIAPDQEYPACVNNLLRIAQRVGARVVRPVLPFPLADPGQIARAVVAAITPRTRACLLSHVTSSTGLILPVEQVVPILRGRGIATIIDGAHAPGFTPLSLRRLDPDFYTANCHKWVCSPKGSAFLYVRPNRQEGVRPVVLSNFAQTGHPTRPFLQTEFDYVGTSDITAWLAIHDAIEFMGGLMPGGLLKLLERNRALTLEARGVLCRALKVEPPAPDSMLASLSTLLLPPQEVGLDARLMARPTTYADALQDALYDRHRIQVPIWRFGAEKRRMVRISVQAYNTPGQYEYLAGALVEELNRERSL
jgi:isopenicillin-N epimerase